MRWTSEPLLSRFTFSQKIISADQKLLRITLSGDQKYRFRTELNEVDPKFIKALLEKEDRYFYFHPGVNPASILMGFSQTFITKGQRRGGSTITMQVARLLSVEGSNSFIGKIKQILSAIALEISYSKKEILEAYLTLAPFGRNIEGLQAATLLYYNKSSRELLAEEIEHLIRLPQNPNSIRLKKELFKVPFRAPHFVDRVLEFREANEIETLQTTLNYKLQNQIEQSLKKYLKKQERDGVNNAAIMVQQISTGHVLAYVGSNHYFSKEFPGQVNGVKARRSPGSLLKPFLFGLALEQGLIHPETLLKDLPQSFGMFDPENFDRAFQGPIHATQALVDSRNVPAVELLKRSTGFVSMLRQFGIENMKSDEIYGLGAAIGGVEVTLEEISALYQQLAFYKLESQIVFSEAQSLVKNYESLSPFLSKEARFVTSQMLRANQLNAGFDRFRSEVPKMAWKTGTSHGFRDAWTAGIFEDFVFSVWIGDFEGETNPAFRGRDLAAPFAHVIVDLLSLNKLKNENQKPILDWNFPMGLNLTRVEVCSKSGGLAKPECPHRKKALFIPGKSPIHECAIHKKVGQDRVVEEWPSDILKLYKQAGIFFKNSSQKQTYKNSSDGTHFAGGGQQLQIILPRAGVIQVASQRDPMPVLMKATFNNGDEKLDWFVDGEFIGSTKPEQELKWTPYIGQFQIKVVAEDGSIDSQNIVVEVAR